jgi:hypothetical protein
MGVPPRDPSDDGDHRKRPRGGGQSPLSFGGGVSSR